ncbi:hypothetical protein [Magnetospira sp. QH-2]|uniref:hypothetical protein n=1 Tax=Magnetospira sp. (strain QH-2) TaxID=1288970 RepID=UPI0003E80F0E|nr:hypothetical protein [Magnetospira sp. QH-2]CCQ74810.1 protein of unknown function [Magnetospira sp. QH-2]
MDQWYKNTYPGKIDLSSGQSARGGGGMQADDRRQVDAHINAGSGTWAKAVAPYDPAILLPSAGDATRAPDLTKRLETHGQDRDWTPGEIEDFKDQFDALDRQDQESYLRFLEGEVQQVSNGSDTLVGGSGSDRLLDGSGRENFKAEPPETLEALDRLGHDMGLDGGQRVDLRKPFSEIYRQAIPEQKQAAIEVLQSSTGSRSEAGFQSADDQPPDSTPVTRSAGGTSSPQNPAPKAGKPGLEKTNISQNSAESFIPEGIQGDIAALAREGAAQDKVRTQYVDSAKKYSEEMKKAYESQGLTTEEAARKASQARNELMDAARKEGTHAGEEIAKWMKRKGQPFEYFENKYAREDFGGKSFSELTDAQKTKVHEKILEKAGSPNPKVSTGVKIAGAAGRSLWVLTVAMSAHNIIVAEDKKFAAIKEGATVGGGLAGGVAGGLVGTACGPGAFICSPLGVLIGGYLGAEGGADLVDGTYGRDGEPIDSDWVMP